LKTSVPRGASDPATVTSPPCFDTHYRYAYIVFGVWALVSVEAHSPTLNTRILGGRAIEGGVRALNGLSNRYPGTIVEKLGK
jgi:hypothetical protein